MSKKITLLLLLSLTLVITGCKSEDNATQENTTPTETSAEQTQQTPDQIDEEIQRLEAEEQAREKQLQDDLEILSEVANDETPKASQCNDISDANLKSSCLDDIYYDEARDNNSVASCDKIQSEVSKEECKLELSS